MTDYKLMPVEPTQEMLDRVMGVVTGFSGESGVYNDHLDEKTAREVYATFSTYAPDVQGEPVGWQYYRYGKWWNGDGLTKKQQKNLEEEGIQFRNVYAAPQPVPNGSALVDALEWYSEQVLGCRKLTSEVEQCRTALDRDGGARARAALATLNKKG